MMVGSGCLVSLLYLLSNYARLCRWRSILYVTDLSIMDTNLTWWNSAVWPVWPTARVRTCGSIILHLWPCRGTVVIDPSQWNSVIANQTGGLVPPPTLSQISVLLLIEQNCSTEHCGPFAPQSSFHRSCLFIYKPTQLRQQPVSYFQCCLSTGVSQKALFLNCALLNTKTKGNDIIFVGCLAYKIGLKKFVGAPEVPFLGT